MEKSKEAAKLLSETKVRLGGYMGKRLPGRELTVAQAVVVGHVFRSEGIKISRLAELLGLSNSTVTGIVDRLEKAGFLERKRSDEDRRIIYVKVTGKLLEKHAQLESAVETAFEELFSGLDPDGLDKIIGGLRELIRALDALKETGETTC